MYGVLKSDLVRITCQVDIIFGAASGIKSLLSTGNKKERHLKHTRIRAERSGKHSFGANVCSGTTTAPLQPPPISSPSSSPIRIIGAGILGLSTALTIQRQLPHGTAITLLAADLPCHQHHPASYASPWAGAHYRPIYPTTPQLLAEHKLAMRTFEFMKTIATDHPEAGVQLVKGAEYLDQPSPGHLAMRDGDVYAGPGDGFRILPKHEMQFLGEEVKWGCEYQSYTVNVPIYCAWLLNRFEAGGGRVVRKRLGGAREGFDLAEDEVVGGKVETVVNCSGTNFGEDPKVSVIRGQTVLVRNTYDRTVTRQYADGRWATLIPRGMGGGTIVGVSKEVGDMEERPRLETRQRLLEQSIECFPDFVGEIDGFEVVEDNVGRRPFRQGGLRLEVEKVEEEEEGCRRRIVHGYGAGGRGYELSWGVAERLAELISQAEKE